MPSLGIALVYNVAKCGPTCRSYKPHVFATNDGRAWREITPPQMLDGFEDALFIDPAHGWVVAGDCAAGRASVHRSTDGGRSWHLSPVGSSNCAAGSRLDLAFSDRKRGWILYVYENGNRQWFSQTSDGGATWTGRRTAPLAGSITAGPSGSVWLSRSDFAAPQRLYVTRDAGRTWRRRVLPPPRGWGGAKVIPDAPVFFGQQGVLPVTMTRGNRVGVAFYVTNDGGMTWRVRATRSVDFSRRSRTFVQYVPTSIASPMTWWIGAGRTRHAVAVTPDAGKTWRVSTSTLPLARSWSISAADSEHAWLTTLAIGRFAIFATVDGGRTWRRLSPPPS